MTTVAFSPDSRLVAAGSNNPNRAVVFSVDTGRPLWQTAEQDEPVVAVRFSPDGSLLLTGCTVGWIRAWSALDGELLHAQQLDESLARMQFWVDGDSVVCQTGRTRVGVWDWRRGRCLHALNCDAHVLGLAVTPVSGLVAFALEGGAVHLWQPPGGGTALLNGGCDDLVGALAFDATGAVLADGGEAIVRIWDVASAQSVQQLDLQGVRYGSVHAAAFQPTGTLLALGMFREEHPIEVWDLRTGGFVQPLDEADDIVHEIAFSSDAHWLAAVSDDRGVGLSVWRVAG